MRTSERGSAVLEFHFLGVLLLVPLVYLMLAVLDVQRAAYGVTQAAREAGRVYVATGSEQGARQAAAIALRDQRVPGADVSVEFSCSTSPCYQPGAEVSVTVHTVVPLPYIPDALAGAIHTQVPVEAKHVSVVDRYRELR